VNVLNEPRGDRYVVLVAGGRSGKTNELIRRTVEAVRAAMPSEVIVREEGVAQALAAERKRIMDEINDRLCAVPVRVVDPEKVTGAALGRIWRKHLP